jgi:hypothetical protein
MRVIAAQPLRSWKLAPELAQARKDLIGTRNAAYRHTVVILAQVDLVAFFQSQLADKVRRQADR